MLSSFEDPRKTETVYLQWSLLASLCVFFLFFFFFRIQFLRYVSFSSRPWENHCINAAQLRVMNSQFTPGLWHVICVHFTSQGSWSSHTNYQEKKKMKP